ncbi:MAG: ATP-binding cassette domain-containing protein, partial [Planctomycetia bacterium]
MADQYIFTMENLSKRHADRQVFKDVSLSFLPGVKIGVLGKNGSGKSTLLRILGGEDKEYEGKAELTKGYTRGYLSQEPRLDPTKDVYGNVLDSVAGIKKLLERYEAINAAFGEPDADFDKLIAEQAAVQEKIERVDGYNLDRKLEIAMDAMRLPPPDADVTKLSGGERRRVALCKILLERPDMLLLDEPTNHLDADSVGWLEQHLAAYTGTVIAVTHDRYFLDNVAEWILELDRGKGYPFKGNYASWLEQKSARLALEEKKESVRQKTLKRELEWVRMSARARVKKSKARIDAYDRLAAEAAEDHEDDFELQIPPGPPLGDLVIEAAGLTKSYGDRLLFENLSFRVPAGAIVGVVGANGAGKSTLFRILVGEEKP